MSRYFLIASLPLLQLGVKPPIRMAAFLSACEASLPEEDLAVMRELLAADGRGSPHPFAREWLDRETELRNAAARLRAQKKGLNPEPWLHPQQGARVFIQTGVADAFLESTPLERERALDLLRWTILDDLAGLDPFGLPAVFAYGLRLRLAERWAAFDATSGAQLLETAAANAAATPGQAAPL